jgi:hypothetical protein
MASERRRESLASSACPRIKNCQEERGAHLHGVQFGIYGIHQHPKQSVLLTGMSSASRISPIFHGPAELSPMWCEIYGASSPLNDLLFPSLCEPSACRQRLSITCPLTAIMLTTPMTYWCSTARPLRRRSGRGVRSGLSAGRRGGRAISPIITRMRSTNRKSCDKGLDITGTVP